MKKDLIKTLIDRGKTSGVRLIELERERQISIEGFTAERDDRYRDDELLRAAGMIITEIEIPDDECQNWMERLSTHVMRKYPDDQIRRLIIAGALIAAEIDRLNRKSQIASRK